MQIREAATKDQFTLFTVYDEDPLNPRGDFDNFGRIICWHSRNNLGDKHQYNEPADFLRSILSSADIGKIMYRLIKQNKIKDVRLVYDRSVRKWQLTSFWDFNKSWGIDREYESGFTDVLLDMENSSAFDATNVQVLIRMGYFSEFGSSGKLLRLYQAFKGGEHRFLKTYIARTQEKRLAQE